MKGLKFSTVQQGLLKTIENTQLVTCIVGHAGIGKSQLVRGVAEEKGFFYRELICSLLQEGDLAFPRIAGDRVIYILNEALVDIIDYCEAHPGAGAVLFLDEFNRASVQVQAELMNLVLQREVMGTTLPEHCYLVLAMNPSSDVEGFETSDYATTAGDAAINDRTMRIRMRADLTDWLDNYANQMVDERTRIYPGISDFLRENGEEAFLVVDDSRDKNPTPRAYERVSTFIYQLIDQGLDIHDPALAPYLLEGIQGSIGEHYGEALFERITGDYAYITPAAFLNQSGNKNSAELLTTFDEMSEIRRKQVIMDLLNAIVKDPQARIDIDVATRYVELLKHINKETFATFLYRLMNQKFAEDDTSEKEGYEAFSHTLYQEDEAGNSITGLYQMVQDTNQSYLSQI
ncbi:MAG: AAA family ATPase [Aerococcus sp.]|nr:AAA family ATPase [Aerococcus sp.]